MKFLMIQGFFILHCCVLCIYCSTIKNEMSLSYSKNNREIREMEKTDVYDPECDLQSDNGETMKNERYPDPKTKDKIISEDYLSLREESKINTPRELIKEVLHPMERLATSASSTTTKFPHGYLYPGTKWCGRGNIAVNDFDLGTEKETDECCRIHDNCPDDILPGETKYNLTNHSSYTSTSCECDNTFYECLRRTNTAASNIVGVIYFNLGARDCFGLDYPRKCKTIIPILKICYEYEVDTSAEKIYQWIPPKKYKKL